MRSQRKIQKYVQTIHGSIDAVFDLLCPVKEKEWLEGWDYRMIYSESGLAEKGCVFETDNAFGTYQWIMTRHNRQTHEIQFVKFAADKEIVILDISLYEGSDKGSNKDSNKSLNDNVIETLQNKVSCEIVYTTTALDGTFYDETTSDMDASLFQKHMKHWEDALNHYIKTGKMLK